MWINKGRRRGMGVHELVAGVSHPEAETGFGEGFEGQSHKRDLFSSGSFLR